MTELDDIAVQGLTSEEARRRLAADGPNELPTGHRRNLIQQVVDVVREPMLLLLLGAGLINFLLADPFDGAILMSFVVVVIGIEVFQEHKTENALAALRDLSSPRALVLRDGQRVRIAGREVVRGDFLLLAEGDRVPADAVLIQCASFSVDESALTGESVPVRKTEHSGGPVPAAMGRPRGDGTPWVFSGTLVMKGQGIAVVLETGAATELGHIGSALSEIQPERTRLQGEVDRLVRVIAAFGVAAAVLVVVVYGMTRGDWLKGTLAGIATAMAMLPEEFPVVLTVFLALGAWRLSQRHVLTRRTPVLETLGSATVICVDKTGTLTLNQMTVRELIVSGETYRIDAPGPLPERFHEIAESSVLASPIDPFDPMDTAFKVLGERCLAETEHLHADWELVREYPLSERLLALSHVWRSPAGDRYVIAAKGAPEAVADLCHFSAERLTALTAQVEQATASGQRVLGVARAYFNVHEGLPPEQHDFDFEFLGLTGLQDPVRPGVSQAVAECRKAGVRTVMITGDYPGTALAIAREIGLDTETYISGPELDSMSQQELTHRITQVCVFARMVPEQKLQLVRALKANGEVVAMTGDGVNDAPALKAADIGIAMGARGTDVAREAAGIVITDDDFSSIVGGIRQGRGIFSNLLKAMSYIIAVHVPIAGMALIPVFVADWPLVLLPVQIAFLQLIIDPICSVVFEAEPIDPSAMHVPPRKVGQPLFGRRVLTLAFLQGASVLLGVFGIYLWSIESGHSADSVRSLTFATLVVGNLALILVNRSWQMSMIRTLIERKNPMLYWIFGVAGILLVLMLSVPAARHAFHFGPVTLAEAALAVVVGFAGVIWFELYKLLARTPD